MRRWPPTRRHGPGRARAGLVAAGLAAGLILSACSAVNAATSRNSDQLLIGTLVPMTGALRHLGPAEAAGIALAIAQINAAGGVLGQPVATVDGDSGDAYTSIASQTVDRELGQKVTAMVGATGSSVTAQVIDKIVGAGVVLVSPGDGTDKLATDPGLGLYFRLVPPDSIQGSVIAHLLKQQGRHRIAVLHVRDLYGAALATELTADVASDGAHVVASVEYDGQAVSYSAQASQVAASSPDAVVLIGTGEATSMIKALLAAGVGPAQVPLYLSDLDLSNVLAQGLPNAVMAGTQGVRAGAAPDPAFLTALAAATPGLVDVGYAAQAYDAVMMIALAADAAHSTTARAIAAQLTQVGTGLIPCTSYVGCLAVLKSDRTVAYHGASGPLPLAAGGSLTSGTFGAYRFGESNTYPEPGFEYFGGAVPATAQ